MGRKTAIALFAIILVAASALYGGGRAEPAAAKPPRTILRVAWWGSQARHERTVAALSLFAKSVPGLTVEYEYAGWNDYWTRLTTQAAAGILPDVIQQDYQYLTEWVQRGLLAPLDKLAARGILDLEDIADGVVAGGRVGNSLYGVSMGVNSTCMMLDVDAFSRAGLALPGDDWTWADFERIALALSRKLGIPAVSGNIVHDHIWRSMYLGKGLWVYAEDGKSLGYPDSEDALFAGQMKLARRLLAAGAMMPYGEIVDARSKSVEDDWIVKGRSAIAFLWSNQVVAVWSAAGVDARRFALRPLPRIAPGAGSSNYMKQSGFFSITRAARRPEAAARLLDFLTNSVDANRILLAERGVPVAGRVREAVKPLLPVPQQAVFDYLGRLEKDAAAVPPPDPVGNTDLINNVFIPQVVDPVLYGVLSPEEAMRTLRREAARILAK